jgi:hypothetical protein
MRVSGGRHISGIHLGLQWRPTSPILVAEFDGLAKHLHFTENLENRIARVRFRIDDYLNFRTLS